MTLNSVSSWSSLSVARVGQGSLLFGMSGVTAHDARYASLKRNERAQSTNGLSTQGSARARAAPKSKGLNFLVAGFLVAGLSSLLGFFCAPARYYGASFCCSPRTGVWGRAPSLSPKGHF